MQVTEVTKEGLRSEYQFIIPSEKITSELEARYKELAKTEKRQGFRPGKVPVALVKARYKKAVEHEVTDGIARETIDNYLKEHKIRPATAPAYKLEPYTEGAPLTFLVNFETMPDMAEIDLESIQLENIVADIPDALVDEMLDHFVKSKAEYTPKENAKKVMKGDAVEIDFEGFMDGVAFDGGAGKNYRLVIGSNSFIPGFEDQLINKTAGEEVEVQVTFPTEYHHAPLAGKDATFKVMIHHILTAKYPEKNDEFAKSLTGFGVQTMEELRKKLAEVASHRYQGDIQLYLKKQLFDALDKKLNFDLPQTMVDAQFEQLWQTAMAQKQENPDFMKKPEDEVKKDYITMAKRRVKLGLYLLELGRIHNVNLTQEEIYKAITQQIQRFPGQEQQVINYFRNNPEAVEEIKGPLFEEKMVDFVLSKAKKKDKTIKLDDIPAYLEKIPGLQEVA